LLTGTHLLQFTYMNDATGDDMIRDAVVQDATGYDLTTKQVEQLFADALVPKSLRSIQRMCKSGHLDTREFQTESGTIFKVNRNSVERRILELQQQRKLQGTDDTSRHVATDIELDHSDAANKNAETISSVSRHAAAHDDRKTRRDVSHQTDSHEIGNDTQRQSATTETVATGDDTDPTVVEALQKRIDVQTGIIDELEKARERDNHARESDQAHYQNLRQFLKEHTDQLYDDHASLRKFTQALLQLPAVRQAIENEQLELPAGIPAMPTGIETETDQNLELELNDAEGADQEADKQNTVTSHVEPSADHNGASGWPN
jgi:hypothetical protein